MSQSGGNTDKKRRYEKFTPPVKLRYKLTHPKEGITVTAKSLARMQSLQMGPTVPMKGKGHFL